MSFPSRLYELQQVDLELSKRQEMLDEISSQLGESELLLRAREELSAGKCRLAEIEKEQRDVEWDVEGLQDNLARLSQKLYGGEVKSSKELLGLEHEVDNLKVRLRQKEDNLLDLMAESEKVRADVEVAGKRLEKLEGEWRQEQKLFMHKQTEIEGHISDLSQKRQLLASQISSQVIALYEGIRSRKGQAVAKAEQGRCQGCRIALSVSEWQRAKAGDLIQCGSCGRILYLG